MEFMAHFQLNTFKLVKNYFQISKLYKETDDKNVSAVHITTRLPERPPL